MSSARKILVEAQCESLEDQIRREFQEISERVASDYSYTDFSGKGDLTFEGYIRSMSVAAEIRKQKFW